MDWERLKFLTAPVRFTLRRHAAEIVLYAALAFLLVWLVSVAGPALWCALTCEDAPNVPALKEKAAEHEGNANIYRERREQAEANYNAALKEAAAAGANNQAATEATRKAKEEYEKAKRAPVDNSNRRLSDAELCAKLRERGIFQPGCP